MTDKAKQKAEELVERYYEQTESEYDETDGGHYRAKQCALIDVNNTIEALYEADIDSNRKTIDFYKQVKQHLEEM